ncbi:MAG TPA: hypothetical protein VGF86_09180 [Candidatus Tumulicola sp.]|jgi:hypothetical protein
MKTLSERMPRRERLRVRLTAEEADRIEELAAADGFTVSDFVRMTLLRTRGRESRVGRRSLASDRAEVVRELNAVGMHLQRLAEIAQTNETVSRDQLEVCLAQIRAAIGAA